MSKLLACPDPHDLQRLALGQLPEPEAAQLGEHVLACDSCADRLNTLCSDDPMVASLQSGVSPLWADNQTADALMKRLLQAPPDAALAATPTVSATEGPGMAHDQPMPAQVGRYQLLGPLGAGGMGVVYRAHDPQLRRDVAVKVPIFRGPDDVRVAAGQRFLREARAAAAVRHPNVCPIHDVGEENGRPFVVMALIEGESLADRLRRHKRCDHSQEAVSLVAQVGDALAAVHALHIVHRDLKPGNILLDRSGQPFLTDFGLARGDDNDTLTSVGQIVGTPAYMAPEQAAPELGSIGPWSDQYSLAVVLYQMLTGKLPFEGSATALIFQIGSKPVPAPSQFRADLDAALERVLMKALSRQARDRYASVADFAAALRAWQPPTKPAAETRIMPAPAKQGRFAAGATWVVLAAIVLVLGGVQQLMFRTDTPTAKKVDPPGSDVAKTPALPFATLDHLDPKNIPPSERFAWQPKELVAVVGEHRGRFWGDFRTGIQNIAFSRDGKTIACSGRGGSDGGPHAQFFDAFTLRETTRPLPGGAAFSPDGKTLAMVGSDGLWLWDITGGDPKPRMQLTDAPIFSLAYSADGKTLAAAPGGHGGEVRLWDLGGILPKERAGVKGFKLGGVRVALAPDGKTLMASEGDGTRAKLWDLSAAMPKERPFLEPSEFAVVFAFSPDGKTLATNTGAEPTVRLWDLATAKPTLMKSVKVQHPPDGLAFSAGGKLLAVRSYLVGGVALLDLAGPEPKLRASIPGWIECFALSPDGKALAVSRGECVALEVWDLTADEPRPRVDLSGSTATMFQALVTPDCKTLVCSHRENIIRLWDLAAALPQPRPEAKGLQSTVHWIALSRDGKTLASTDDRLRLWDLSQAEPAEKPGFKGAYAREPVFLPDGKTLAVYGVDANDEGIRLLDLTGAEPKERAWLKNSKGPHIVTPDGKFLICQSYAGGLLQGLRMWDLTAPEPREPTILKAEGMNSLTLPGAISPDGKLLAVLPSDDARKIWLWKLDGPKPRLLDVLDTPCCGAAFAADSKTLAAAHYDGVTIWDATTSKQKYDLKLPGLVIGVSFAPDGRHLITANANGTAYILRLSTTGAKKSGD